MAAPDIVSNLSLPLWLGLNLTPGLGLRGVHKLLAHFRDAAAIYSASLTELESCDITAAVAQSLHDGRSAALGAEEAERVAQLGISVVTLGDREYPELLREIHDPPVVLYIRGRIEALDTFGIASVGTRHPTLYGKLMAEKLGRDLGQWGLTVFSGLARGIDAISQRACLEAHGCTVAVMGTGVDTVYPSENRKLAEAIIAGNGALVSEFPLATVPAAQNFPLRNRVISGLSLAVLIVEGGEYSGSRITARMALEQNRDVYAVPGMATQKQACLPNMLIKQGAKLITDVTDIIEELPSAVRVRLTPPPPVVSLSSQAAMPDAAAGEAMQWQAVLKVLATDEISHVDEIVNRLENKLSAPEILTVLFDLELAGRVRQFPGKKYLRVS